MKKEPVERSTSKAQFLRYATNSAGDYEKKRIFNFSLFKPRSNMRNPQIPENLVFSIKRTLNQTLDRKKKIQKKSPIFKTRETQKF